MIELNIPGRGDISIKNVVFDVNGTIAVDGLVTDGIKEKLAQLEKKVSIYLLTADTYGTIESEMGKSGIRIHRVTPPEEAKKKDDFITKIGEQQTIAVGNGENDKLMLKRAAVGICVIDREGASAEAVRNADIVVYGQESVFDLLNHPERIIATLRE